MPSLLYTRAACNWVLCTHRIVDELLIGLILLKAPSRIEREIAGIQQRQVLTSIQQELHPASDDRYFCLDNMMYE